MLKLTPNIILFSLSLLIAGCGSSVTETLFKTLDIISLNETSSISLISNTTNEKQAVCSQQNTLRLQISVPGDRKLYCRDRSKLLEGLALGPVCEGGAVIAPLTASDEVVDCKQLKVCGIGASSIKSISERSDGGTILEVTFQGLPWGCDGNLEYSFDSSFGDSGKRDLHFYVRPPDCPFCQKTNRKTCLPCSELGNGEVVVGGELIRKCLPGDNCKSCLVNPTETIPHAAERIFFSTAQGTCEKRCKDNKATRVCNDGLFAGDPKYQFAQCADLSCGCKLPGKLQVYDDAAQITIFKTVEPACGIACSSLALKCFDGQWKSPDGKTNFTDAELIAYPALSCTKKVCNCARTGRVTVNDGAERSVFTAPTVMCGVPCSTVEGKVKCDAGMLKPVDPLKPTVVDALKYPYDACQQADCGCKLNLLDANQNPAPSTVISLANNASLAIWSKPFNTASDPGACELAENKVTVTCVDGKITTPYNADVFKYNTCKKQNFSCYFKQYDPPGNLTPTLIEVKHGDPLPVYKIKTPPCAQACEGITLKCDNTNFVKQLAPGVVTAITPAELDLYKVTVCGAKNCTCNLNGFIINHGQSLSDFYTTDVVTSCNLNGCVDSKATLSCNDKVVTAVPDPAGKGTVTDPTKYLSRTCSVKKCACQLPWGGTIENDRTISLYSVNSATCADPGRCEATGNTLSVTCKNGQFDKTIDAKFQFATCSPAVCSCQYGNTTTPFGNQLTIYKAAMSSPGITCASLSAKVTCQPGGIWDTATVKLSDYPFTSCTQENDSGVGGGTGGGSGNDEGPGSAIKKRMLDSSKPPPCYEIAKCRSDFLGGKIPTFNKNSCVLPWGMAEVEFYASITAFKQRCVVKPARCSDQRIVRTCHFPKWTGSDDYKYPACEEKDVCP